MIGKAADMFLGGKCLKHRGEGGPDEAGRRDDGEVDRGGRGLEREGVMYPSRQSSGYLRPLTLPPPLTTFYGRNKTRSNIDLPPPLLRPLLSPVVQRVRLILSVQQFVVQVNPLLRSTS